MRETNNTEAPRRFLNRRNAFLAALHVLVLGISLVVHPPVTTGVGRALP